VLPAGTSWHSVLRSGVIYYYSHYPVSSPAILLLCLCPRPTAMMFWSREGNRGPDRKLVSWL